MPVPAGTSNSALAGQKPTGVDASSLKGIINRAGLQKSDPPAFQTINNLIDGIKLFQDFARNALTGLTGDLATLNQKVDDFIILANAAIASLQTQVIYIAEIDTSSPPPPINIALVNIAGFILVKDIAGNASVNNITFIGNVDGAPALPITTNYGTYKFYFSPLLSLYFTW